MRLCSSLFLVFIVLLLNSCENSEYREISGGIKKKLIRFGDGETYLSNSQFVDIQYAVESEIDGELIKYENQLFLSDFHPSIFGSENLHKDLEKLKTGDSVIYIANYIEIKDQILDEFATHEIAIQDTNKVKINFGVVFSYSESEYLEQQALEVRKGLAKEMELINQYIENKSLQERVVEKEGINYFKLKEMNTEKVEVGDEVFLKYKCQFLDEQMFDEISEEDSLFITIGTPDQIIPGMEAVIKELNNGEQARAILPSYAAFGDLGSTDGRVPPKTPIIVDVTVLDILN